MKIIAIFFISLFITQASFSQQGWDYIELGNWGSIKMPNSMEVQSGNYKKILDYTKRHFSINAERIVFQQKGLNEGKNLETYARVIIRTDFADEKLPDLNKEILTGQDLYELNHMYGSGVYEFANNPTFPVTILKWNELKVVTLNGNKALNYSYVRQMKGKSHKTYSEFYVFWKGNRQHSLNIEYRINDAHKWQDNLESCAKTFKLK